MSEQHESEVVPVEVDQDHEVVETRPSEGEVGGAVTAEQDPTPYESDEDRWEDNGGPSYAEERYERASLDPEYAEQQAIEVDEDDRGPAWEYGSLAAAAALENAEDLPVHGEDSDDDDSSEEV